jgi:hypothetical protein
LVDRVFAGGEIAVRAPLPSVVDGKAAVGEVLLGWFELQNRFRNSNQITSFSLTTSLPRFPMLSKKQKNRGLATHMARAPVNAYQR